MSSPVLRICIARGRIFRRFLVEHAFVLFILGPMILGAVAWVAERYLDLLRGPLLDWLEPAAAFPDRPSAVLGLIAGAWLWPAALREIFGPRGQTQDLLDTLPVRERDRYLVIWLSQSGRSWVLAGLFLPLLWALHSSVSEAPFGSVSHVVGLLLAFPLIGSLSLLGAAVTVPLGWASSIRLLVLAGAAVALLALPGTWPLWVLFPWVLAGQALKAPLVAALGPLAGADGGAPMEAVSVPTLDLWLSAATLAVVFTISGLLIVRRRRRDLEKAQALDLPQGRGPSFSWVSHRRFGRLPASTGAQLRRDLLMIYRRFSPAVPAALALTLFADLVMVLLSFETQVPDLWVRRAMVAAGFVGQLSLLSLVPFLLKAQLPVFWLEKSTGVALEHVWLTKWVLAVGLALPQWLLTVAVLILAAPGAPLEVATAGVISLIVSLVAATLVGVAVFEIAEQPILGLTLSGFFASAAASLFIFYPQAWWLWLIFVGYFVSQLTGRASRRVRFTEVER